MTQQHPFVRHLELVEATPTAHACVALGHDATLPQPRVGGMLVCVVQGSGVAQRWVAGHWVDCVSFLSGAVLLADGQARMRIHWHTVPEGLAISVPPGRVSAHFAHIAPALAGGAVLQMAGDSVATSLARLLAVADAGADGTRVADHVCDVMLARVAQLSRERLLATPVRYGVLPAWRLRRVEALVREKLGEALTLNDMAAAAGLSPMHFAAQFRRTTGMRPHHYLLMQRIEHAKMLLGNARHSILDVALSVGFQTQAHFTSVFRRMEQTTPSHWRRNRIAA